MRMSRMLMPTLKEVPSDAEITSHQLMLRAGMIRKMASGIYNQLPMGIRVFRKVEDIIREEMNAKGAQEISCALLVLLNYGKNQEDGMLWVLKCSD